MSREEIIRMAREAGFQVASESWWVTESEALDRFAALVAAAEREACAQVCEALRDDLLEGLGRYEFMGEGADFCAEAIRARGKQE